MKQEALNSKLGFLLAGQSEAKSLYLFELWFPHPEKDDNNYCPTYLRRLLQISNEITQVKAFYTL